MRGRSSRWNQRQRLKDAFLAHQFMDQGEADIEMVEETLCCPCGEENTHQVGVRVCFSQTGEDSDKVRTTYSDRKTAEVREEFRTPDVGRRDAVFIHMICEHCDRRSVLRIQQHKGRTMLRWVTNTHPWAPWEPDLSAPETPDQRTRRLIELARAHRLAKQEGDDLFSVLDFESAAEKEEAFALLKTLEDEGQDLR